MIPKIIHYCWLSNDPMPAELKRCIKSWKRKLPDYKIKKWDTHNFDIYSIPFVAEACKMRKWAFACDYIRVYALYTEGGIYLDSDVFVRNSLDFCLANIAIDYGFKFKDEEQDLKSGLKIYSSSLFASNMELITEKAVAIHCCAGSWRWMPSSSMAYAVQYMKEIIKNILFRLHLRGGKTRGTLK